MVNTANEMHEEAHKEDSEKSTAKNTFVYEREDDYGTGPGREKKGSLQDHKYINDTTVDKKVGKNGNPDTIHIRKKKD